jgi:hypothetical protein
MAALVFLKELVCDVIGYPRPGSFKKTNPRFLGQNFDTYVQKSNNLQVWNEELDPTRRYVMIRVDAEDNISRVKVVTGDVLAMLDTTGTLTQKYQARLIPSDQEVELISSADTDNIGPILSLGVAEVPPQSPIDFPSANSLLSITEIFDRLRPLVGRQFDDIGSVIPPYLAHS